MAKTYLESTAGLTALVRRMVETATEAFRLQTGKPIPFAPPNTVVLDLKTMHLRDHSSEQPPLSMVRQAQR